MESMSRDLTHKKKEKQIWDQYVDRQLEHLVVEYQFMFDKIAVRLSGSFGDPQQVHINEDSCRQRWKQLHEKRYQDKDKDRQDRVSKSVMRFENPINALTVDEMVEALPKTRSNKDFLKISDSEKAASLYLSETGEKKTPTTFNVLKDSVMGIKDKRERDRVFKVQQDEFFKNLEMIAQEKDEEMFEKPLIFRARFLEQSSFIVEREELTKEQASKILAQKIQLKGSGIVPPEPEMGIKMDNFVSMFAARRDEDESSDVEIVQSNELTAIEEAIERKHETELDLVEFVKQIAEPTEEERQEAQFVEEEKKKINPDLYLAEQGLKTIDDAVTQLEKMREKAKVNNYFEDEQASRQAESQRQQESKLKMQALHEKLNQVPVKADEDDRKLSQNIIQQGLAQLTEKETGNQLVQFHETQIQKDIKELNEIIGEKAKPKQAADQASSKSSKPIVPPSRQRFLGIEGSDESDEDDEDSEDNDDDLYLQAQRQGMRTEKEIDSFIAKQKELKLQAAEQQASKKRVNFGEARVMQEKSADEVFAIHEKQIEQKQQFVAQMKKRREESQKGEEEENEQSSWRDLNQSAGIAFKQKLLEEHQQREMKKAFEEAQKMKADAERIRKIQEDYQVKKIEIQNKLQSDQPLPLEKLNSEKWKEYMAEQQRKREEIEREHAEKNRILQEEEQRVENEQAVKDKTAYFEKKIKQFPSNDIFKSFFDEQVSYLSQVAALPAKVALKVSDTKKYDITRDGITARYQTLVFPHFENAPKFSREFLGYFLRNSFFKTPPTEQELGEVSSDKIASNPLEEIPCGRLSSKGFPFCLVSFFIGSWTELIKDEQDGQYLSNYLIDSYKFETAVNGNKMEKNVFLFFDTYLGRGHEILAKQLDLSLNEFISPASLAAVSAKNPEINADTTLDQLKRNHFKNVDITKKLFMETHTFHSVCPQKTSCQFAPSIDKQQSQHDKKVSSSQNTKAWETSVLIIRQYSEVAKPASFNNNQSDAASFENTTAEYATITSTQNEHDDLGLTEISQKQRTNPIDIINYTLQRIAEKGIQLLGIKSFYFDSTTHSEFKNYVENIHFNQNPNQPVVVLSLAAFNLHSKLKKLVGSEDAQLARRVEPHSLNAIFSRSRSDSIIIPYNKALSRRMLSYFFSGRISRIETIQQVQEIENLQSKKQQLYLTRPPAFSPIFLLNSQPTMESICILSSKFQPNHFGEIIRKVQTRGFDILNIRTINTTNLSFLIKSDEEFSKFISSESLEETISSHETEQAIHLVLHITGPAVSALRTHLLEKILNYNPIFHPEKKQLLYYTKSAEHAALIKDTIFRQAQKSKFSPSDSFPIYIAMWPFLADSENSSSSHLLSLGQDLKVFAKYNLELMGLSRISASDIISSTKAPSSNVGGTGDSIEQNPDDLQTLLATLLQNNIEANPITKRKPEFKAFSSALAAQAIKEDFYFAVLRFQGDRNSKHLDRLFLEHPFVHSNKTLNESVITNFGAASKKGVQKQVPAQIPTEFLTLFFLNSSSIQVNSFADKVGVGVFDDCSLKSSFIYDLPSSGFTDSLETVLLLSSEVVKILLLEGLLKIIENNHFEIKSLYKLKASEEFAQIIVENISATMAAAISAGDEGGTRRQKFEVAINNFHSRISTEPVYLILLGRQNSIFAAKKMVYELAEKFSIFKKEQITPENATAYMLEKGMYSSLNYRCQQREVKEFQILCQNVLSLNQEELAAEQLASLEKACENQVVILLRIDGPTPISDILRKLTSDLKFKVLQFLILRQFDWTDIQYFSTLFTPKFDPSHIAKYFELNNDGVYAIIHLDAKNSVSLSDAFGTVRLNDQGEFKSVIKSSLFGKNGDAFFIYTNSSKHVLKLSRFAFSTQQSA